MRILKLKNLKKNCTMRFDDEMGWLISFSGGVYKLNEISSEIIFKIEEGKSSKEVIDHLSQKYNTPSDIIGEDVIVFLEELTRIGLYKE